LLEWHLWFCSCLRTRNMGQRPGVVHLHRSCQPCSLRIRASDHYADVLFRTFLLETFELHCAAFFPRSSSLFWLLSYPSVSANRRGQCVIQQPALKRAVLSGIGPHRTRSILRNVAVGRHLACFGSDWAEQTLAWVIFLCRPNKWKARAPKAVHLLKANVRGTNDITTVGLLNPGRTRNQWRNYHLAQKHWWIHALRNRVAPSGSGNDKTKGDATH